MNRHPGMPVAFSHSTERGTNGKEIQSALRETQMGILRLVLNSLARRGRIEYGPDCKR